jgi:hypothetical protein
MAKTPEQLDELLKLVRDEDVATLRALERQLHLLLEQKERDEAPQRHGETATCYQSDAPMCPSIPIFLPLSVSTRKIPSKTTKFLFAKSSRGD